MEEMVFGNRYRTIEKIGSGGMADVYKAMDEVLGRTVAVKVLHPHYASDPAFVQRFRQEAQSAANLSHPNIVNMYDWGQQGGTYYIVMEYVRGTDLRTLLEQRGRMDPVKVADWAAQVCAGLSVAHGYGIIHRDIKSHNLILTPDGTVKIMDFGIARAVNTTMTQTGSVLGTAQYVSPEQAQGRTLTPATDLYSLGVVVFELACGRLPFDGDTPVTVALKHVNETPPPVRAINPDVPPALEAIITRAMEKDPARRYASAEQMRDDLNRFAQGRAVEATPQVGDTTMMPPVAAGAAGASRRAAPPKRRGSMAWVWIAAILIAIAAGLGAAYAFGLFTPQMTIPADIQGMELEEAKAKLLEMGLKVGQVDPKPDETIAEGKVVSTDPAIGTVVTKGDTVDIVVSSGPPQVAVPDVTSMKKDDAIAALENAGFKLDEEIIEEFNPEVEAGKVSKQDPVGNTQAVKGSVVKIWISKGIEMAPIPYVVDKKVADAIDKLQQAGFVVKQVEQFSTTAEKGVVTAQSPAGGGKAPKGSEITITVSKGPEMVTVPDVTGMTETDAKAKLASVGLTSGVTSLIGDPKDGTGKVTNQNPEGTKSVVKGTKVTIEVGPAGP